MQDFLTWIESDTERARMTTFLSLLSNAIEDLLDDKDIAEEEKKTEIKKMLQNAWREGPKELPGIDKHLKELSQRYRDIL